MPPKGSQASHNKVHDTSFICSIKSSLGCGKQEVTMTHGEQNLEVQIM